MNVVKKMKEVNAVVGEKEVVELYTQIFITEEMH